jgi:phospholipase C
MTKRIDHLVVLMMENRSFDHSLGFLKSAAYKIDGLNGNETNPDSQGVPVKVTPDARYAGDFTPDPGHDFISVNQQIFDNVQGTGVPTMQGFVKAYQGKTGNVAKSHNIMKCFAPGRLPALTTLAQQFAVCDRWFASVPGPTLPNRAFVYGATSLGRVDMNPIYLTLKTIFERLDQNGVSSKIYYNDWCLGLANGYILKNARKFLSFFDDFLKDCRQNKLPAYSFIEPRYNDFSDRGQFFPAADQHPDHNVFQGEIVIKAVYDAIRSNQQTWESTLLVITYDEHGGLYDHVSPPATTNPGDQPPGPFNFDRLGVRVPAVLVSPFIPKGTIIGTVITDNGQDKVFDHTSIIATARKLFLNDFANSFLTERDRHARTFEDCLTLTAPRAHDEVTIPQPTNAPFVAGVGRVANTGAAARTPRLSDVVTDHLLAAAEPARSAAAPGKARKSGATSEQTVITRGVSLKAAGLNPSDYASDQLNDFQVAMLLHVHFAGIETEQGAAKELAVLNAKVRQAKRPAKSNSAPKKAVKKKPIIVKKAVKKSKPVRKVRKVAKRR